MRSVHKYTDKLIHTPRKNTQKRFYEQREKLWRTTIKLLWNKQKTATSITKIILTTTRKPPLNQFKTSSPFHRFKNHQRQHPKTNDETGCAGSSGCARWVAKAKVCFASPLELSRCGVSCQAFNGLTSVIANPKNETSRDRTDYLDLPRKYEWIPFEGLS